MTCVRLLGKGHKGDVVELIPNTNMYITIKTSYSSTSPTSSRLKVD